MSGRVREKVVRSGGIIQVMDGRDGAECQVCGSHRYVRYSRFFAPSLAVRDRPRTQNGEPEAKNVYLRLCADCCDAWYQEVVALRAGEAGDDRGQTG